MKADMDPNSDISNLSHWLWTISIKCRTINREGCLRLALKRRFIQWGVRLNKRLNGNVKSAQTQIHWIFWLNLPCSQHRHISHTLEMRPHLPREMCMWVRGMRISKGDDTSPVGNDRVSRGRCSIFYGRFARISKFRDMWHYSGVNNNELLVIV